MTRRAAGCVATTGRAAALGREDLVKRLVELATGRHLGWGGCGSVEG